LQLKNLKSKPIYELRGVVTQSGANYFTITVNSELVIKVYGPLTASETLVIDADKMTAKVVETLTGTTIRNGLAQLETLTFPELLPGVNTIDVAATNGTFTALKIYSRSGHISNGI
jgi:phage-related protein